MVYLDGDNDLESYALKDFIEMSSIGSDNDINIVVMLDRISGYSTLYDNWTNCRRGYINFMDQPDSSWGESLGEMNMGDPQTLKDFATWASQSYPSNRNMLILWNHGAGWSDSYGSLASVEYLSRSGSLPRKTETTVEKAICTDSTDNDELTLAEIRLVTQQLATEEGIYIDIFGMDACLMAMAEVITELYGHTDYFIGSAAEEPADGWPYDLILQDLQINPFMTQAELCNTVVSRYCQYYRNDVTLSAFRMQQVPGLVNALADFSETMLNHQSESIESIINSSNSVRSAISETTVAQDHSQDMVGANGLSINFPASGSQSGYSDRLIFVGDTVWKDFLDSYPSLAPTSWVKTARANTLQYESGWDYFDIIDFADNIVNSVPAGLTLSPESDMIIFGESGGPFSVYTKTYQLTNAGGSQLQWSASVPENWLIVNPTSGTFDGGQSTLVTVSINQSEATKLSEGSYHCELVFTDNVFAKNVTLGVELHVGVSDSYSELFTDNSDDDFDLAYKTILFTPDSNGTKYSVCVTNAIEFETDTTNATILNLNDDDSLEVSVGGNFLPFFGITFNCVYVGSNGYLTYGVPDTEYEETINNHFKIPRISALFDDLDPQENYANISYKITEDRLAVTYDKVPQTFTSQTNTFQIQHFFNGQISITFLDISSKDAITGLSDGKPRSNFIESDLSNYSTCKIPDDAPMAISSKIPVIENNTTSFILSAYDNGQPEPLQYIIDALPLHGKLYDEDALITEAPYNIGQRRKLKYQAPVKNFSTDQVVWFAHDGASSSDFAIVSFDIQTEKDFFTELFLPGEADLSGISVTLKPDDSDNYYTPCRSSISELPVNPVNGTEIFIGPGNDEKIITVNISAGKTFELYGTAWTSFNICSNGYISFGPDEQAYIFSFAEHFSKPGISMFFTDLDPSYGQVYHQQLDDRIVVSFVEVVEYAGENNHTFQAEMFFNGEIRLSWLNISSNSETAGVGISAGTGMPPAFNETDFSGILYLCDSITPVATNQTISIPAGTQQPIVLQAINAQGYIISSLPTQGDLFLGNTKITTTPYSLNENNIVLYFANRNALSDDLFSWYAFSTIDGSTQLSNTATVSIDIFQCSIPQPPVAISPAHNQTCFPLNLPLIWDVTGSLAKSYPEYYKRSDSQKQAILAKSQLITKQDGQVTISDTPLLSFLKGKSAVTKILAFTKYSDNTPGGELENTLNAIARFYPDFSVTLTDTEDPLAIENLLKTHHVFLVPEQELSTPAQITALATSFGTSLKNYAERGGAVIVCDYSWGANEFMSITGLMQVGQATIINNVSLDTNQESTLTEGMTESFLNLPGTVYYATTTTDALVSYQQNPVCLVKRTGNGFALLMGWDYYSYDNNMARLIANAVREAGRQFEFRVYLDTFTPPTNIIAEDLAFHVFDPGVLAPDTQYFWQVEAYNKCGDFVSSDIWSFQTSNSISDFDGNCIVNLADFATLAAYWLETDCNYSWFSCDGTDSDRNGQINISDLENLAENWLQ